MGASLIVIAIVSPLCVIAAVAVVARQNRRLLVNAGVVEDMPGVVASDSHPPSPGTLSQPSNHRWVMLRVVLLLLNLAAYICVGATYRHSADVESLFSEVSAGQVSSVTVTPGIPAGATGSVVRTVTWSTGFFERYRATEAEFINEPGETAESTASTILRQSLESRLLALDPVIHIHISGRSSDREIVTTTPDGTVSVGQADGPHSTISILGQPLPRWWTIPFIGYVIAFGFLFFAGPEPWRFNRWGWFWLTLIVPAGQLGYLLFGGQTSRRFAPRTWRGQSAWSAFGLAIVLGFALRFLGSALLGG